MVGEDLFPFCRLLFCFIYHVLYLTEIFSFRRSYLLIGVALSVCATGVIFRKLSSVTVHSRLLPTFSSIRFSVPRFNFRSSMHLNFVHGNRYGYICNLLHVDFQLCQHHLLKMLSFFCCTVFVSLSKIRCS